MIADVRSQQNQFPVLPFLIRTSGGHQYVAPTVDHVFIAPRGNQVVIASDDGRVATLGPLHINAVIEQPNGV
jgi:hypothetical protein